MSAQIGSSNQIHEQTGTVDARPKQALMLFMVQIEEAFKDHMKKYCLRSLCVTLIPVGLTALIALATTREYNNVSILNLVVFSGQSIQFLLKVLSALGIIALIVGLFLSIYWSKNRVLMKMKEQILKHVDETPNL